MANLRQKITSLFLTRYGSFQGNPQEVAPADWDRVDWQTMDGRMGRRRMGRVLPYIPAGGRHLDLGTGAGHGTALLAERTGCVGIDYGMASLGLAHGRGLAVAQADGRRLPFATGSFDSATCLDVLEHIPAGGEAVAELGRVLRPGGVLVLMTPTSDLFSERLAKLTRDWGLLEQMQPYDQPYTLAEVRSWLGQAGLEVVEQRVVVNWVPNFLLRLITRTRLFVCRKGGPAPA